MSFLPNVDIIQKKQWALLLKVLRWTKDPKHLGQEIMSVLRLIMDHLRKGGEFRVGLFGKLECSKVAMFTKTFRKL